MPDLFNTLRSQDLGFLRIVARLWGVELESVSQDDAAEELAEALCDAELIEEVVLTLPVNGHSALLALISENGKIPWSTFTRQFGEIREMGAGKRDREQPFLHPGSTAEVLWYRSLVARAFFDASGGPQEFAFIPDDLLAALAFIEFPEQIPKNRHQQDDIVSQSELQQEIEPLGRPASAGEREHIILSDDNILDDACTYLAALRVGKEYPLHRDRTAGVILKYLLTAAGLIEDNLLQPEPVRVFLEAARGEALVKLVNAWLQSDTFNDLHLVPGLIFEGDWKNDPLETRKFLLKLIFSIPRLKWWSLAAFIGVVRDQYADFQRPAGDYDSWFIRRAANGAYLRGFNHWNEVEGEFIRSFITGVLFRLGIVDLAAPGEGEPVTAFRVTEAADGLLQGKIPERFRIEKERLHIQSRNLIAVPWLAPRAVRYQVARFCDWEQETAEEYRYRVTPASLNQAREQGLKVEQLLSLLRKHSGTPIPPVFVRALQRWEQRGTEARVEQAVVLRLASPEILNELLKTRAARFLGEKLGPTAVVIKAGAQNKVLSTLAEMGLLAEDKTNSEPEE